jgi:hypothetical protein
MKIRFAVAALCTLFVASSVFAQLGPLPQRNAGFSVDKFPFNMNDEITLQVNGTLTYPRTNFPTARPMVGASQCWFHGGYSFIQATGDTSRWNGVQGGWRSNPPSCRFTARPGVADVWDLKMRPATFFPDLPAGRVIIGLNFVVNDGPGGERSGGMPMPTPDPNNNDGRIDVFMPMLPPTATSVSSDEFVEAINVSPNPTSSIAQIGFGMRKPGTTSVRIFNALGSEIKTLASAETYPQGYHVLIWEGDDNQGKTLANGVYYYRIEVNGTTKTGQVVLNR